MLYNWSILRSVVWLQRQLQHKRKICSTLAVKFMSILANLLYDVILLVWILLPLCIKICNFFSNAVCPVCPILANLLCVMSYYYGLYKDVVFVTAEFISIFANIVCAHIWCNTTMLCIKICSFCSGGVYVHFCQRSEKGWKRGAPPGLRGHLLPNLGEILDFRVTICD